MSINLSILIENKLQGIDIIALGGFSELISAGAVDILEKIKMYKEDDLQKFIIEENVYGDLESLPWTKYNATGIYAWEFIGVKRSMDLSILPDIGIPSSWKTAEKLSITDKDDYLNPNSLKFISNAYPGFTIESYTNVDEDDGDNDSLAFKPENGNYIITVFPQINSLHYHAWKIRYIPIPEIDSNDYTIDNFHSSYIPALAIYVAKNIVLNEMNRLLLSEEDLELATELKNHYALLEQEYASLMNIPPKKEAQR